MSPSSSRRLKLFSPGPRDESDPGSALGNLQSDGEDLSVTARVMKAKVKVWESQEFRGDVQNLFTTFKGHLLEEEASEMDLKVYIAVCQLKKDI